MDLAFFQTPLGAALIVVAAVFVPQLRALLPLLQRKPATPAPAAPSEPVALKVDAPSILSAAIEVLKALARSKFPWMPLDQAMHRFAAEAIGEHEKQLAKKAEDTVKSTPPTA